MPHQVITHATLEQCCARVLPRNTMMSIPPPICGNDVINAALGEPQPPGHAALGNTAPIGRCHTHWAMLHRVMPHQATHMDRAMPLLTKPLLHFLIYFSGRTGRCTSGRSATHATLEQCRSYRAIPHATPTGRHRFFRAILHWATHVDRAMPLLPGDAAPTMRYRSYRAMPHPPGDAALTG